MAETKEEIDRATAALAKRLPNANCPMCRGTSWSAGTIELEPRGGFPLKLLQLTCAKCCFVSLHDLDALFGP
jgi:hypothetical protein